MDDEHHYKNGNRYAGNQYQPPTTNKDSLSMNKQQEADRIKAQLRKAQERDDHKVFMGKNQIKQTPIAGRSRRRAKDFKF